MSEAAARKPQPPSSTTTATSTPSRRRSTPWRSAAVAAALGGAAVAASAQSTESAAPPLWEAGVGAAWVHLPHYRGSDESRSWLLPLPYVVYRGDIIRADRDGARAVLLDTDRFEFDVSVSGSAPAKSRDSRARVGMADLAPTVEIGPNLNATLARGRDWTLQLRVPVHAVFTVERDPQFVGATLSPVVNVDTDVAGWSVGVQGGPRWASRRHHRYFYTVDAADATASRPAYDAPGGGAGWRVTAAASKRSGAWWVGGFVRADTVAGAAFEDSPLVRRRHQLSAGVALAWVFARSTRAAAPSATAP